MGGQVVTCAHNELAAGACAGGSHHDCKDGSAVHSLYCCPVSERIPIVVNEEACTTLHSGYGYSVDCSTQSTPACPSTGRVPLANTTIVRFPTTTGTRTAWTAAPPT